jgi:hypothetical protein
MPSVFESFNAKNLSPLQVANTFIPPARQFGQLCSRAHSVVLGPRGSGKTTLLKMLQVQALSAWSHPDAKEYIGRIDFNAIFVPADIVWKAQFESRFSVGLPPAAARRLGIASFTTHIFVAITTAFEAAMTSPASDVMARFHVNLTPVDEAALVDLLSNAWLIKPRLPSLLGLRMALQQRLSDIASFAGQLVGQSDSAIDAAVNTRQELYLTFYEQAVFAIEAFNGLAKQPYRQWALLFDELEIAPEEIRQQLISLLRGTDTRVLLKLSMSPYNKDFEILSAEDGAAPSHDFDPISLWYSEKEEALPFALDLTASMLKDMGEVVRSPISIFGTSEFDMGRDDHRELGSAYAPGSSNYRRFSDLAARDQSFLAYLDRNGIELRRMQEISDVQRASQIRKLTSLVTVREAFLRAAPTGDAISANSKLRSRKRPQLYTGASALFALTEGNPRWIIGTIGPLLKTLSAEKTTVSKSEQAKFTALATNRFRALLSTIPMEYGSHDQRRNSLLSLIDIIGQHFSAGVILAPFKPEPPTSFYVDDATPLGVVKGLEIALNQGAIVFIPETPDQKVVDNIVGSRFRLTYLLAPLYRLPLTTGKARNLSTILSNADAAAATHDLFGARK